MKRTAIFLAFCSMAAMTTLAGAQSAKTSNLTGYISDSMCGAKHMGTGADCVKKCIAGGEKPVFVDANKNVWAIDNPGAISVSNEGAKVKVVAVVNATGKSIHVDKIMNVSEGASKSSM
ncbi:MAG: hypothetical protein ACP5EP_04375 [Acidobacteriaceae bacterium]